MENPDPVTVDYTHVLHQEHLLRNVLNFLPDDTLDDTLDSLLEVDENFQGEVNSERRRRISQKLLTYGAVAVREGHEDDERVLRNILGDQGNWNTSRNALTFVARTFSGAKHGPDGPYDLSDLYPDNPDSKLAFRKVHQWWNWMCDHNRTIAIQTDLLSFFLFAGENWKEKSGDHYQTQLVPESANFGLEMGDLDDWSDNLDVVNTEDGTRFVMKAEFYRTNGNFGVVANKTMTVRDHPDEDYSFGLSCGTHHVLFTNNGPEQDISHAIFSGEPEKSDKFNIDKNSTTVWAHACVDTLRTDIESMYSMPQLANLKTFHARRVNELHRFDDKDLWTMIRGRFMSVLF